MTDFLVTITDPEWLAGITWAREQRNASLPPPPADVLTPLESDAPLQEADASIGEGEEGEGDPQRALAPPTPLIVEEGPPPPPTEMPHETDEEYVQWLMEQAAASYAVQQEQATWRQAYEDAQTESRRKREARLEAEAAAKGRVVEPVKEAADGKNA